MLGQAATICVSLTVNLGTFAIGAVALRLYCRRMQKLTLGGDDYFMIAALLFSCALSILNDYGAATTGIGNADYSPSMDTVIFTLKVAFWSEMLQVIAMCLVKTSILLFYRRIFITRVFNICSAIILTVQVLFTLGNLLAWIFSKGAPQEQWNPRAPYKISIAALLITTVSMSTVLDILTLILPLVSLRSLQMNKHRKLMLATTFSLGSRQVFKVNYDCIFSFLE
ncbi:MAG: hypothetical protein Q9160_008956 [Pyrenula sp. 1 TL-2023]